MKVKPWRRWALFLCAVALCAAAAGCSNYENPAKAPADAETFIGIDGEDAVSMLKNAGFVDVRMSAAMTTKQAEAGKVKSISIDGKSEFTKDDIWENTVPVKLKCYALKHYAVELEIEESGNEGEPEFLIHTNLPDKSKITLVLKNENGFQQTQDIEVKNGEAKSGKFTDGNNKLKGKYTLAVEMRAEKQKTGIQSQIGQSGECMTGECVREDETGRCIFMEYEYVSALEELNLSEYMADESSVEKLAKELFGFEYENLKVWYDDSESIFVVSFCPEMMYGSGIDWIRANINRYINFCRTAYEIKGIDRLRFDVYAKGIDEYGKEGVFIGISESMPRENFEKYDWDALELLGIWESFVNNCEELIIDSLFLENFDRNGIFYDPFVMDGKIQ